MLRAESPQSHDADWLIHEEGQLSVDVIETEQEVIIRSAIAGVSSGDLDIHVTTDAVTIRGSRHEHAQTPPLSTVHIQECHWGGFSRSIILPSPILPEKTQANLQQGILTIRLKKTEITSRVSVVDLDMLM